MLLLVTTSLLLTPPSLVAVESPTFVSKIQRVPEVKPKLEAPIAIVASTKLPSDQPTNVAPTGNHEDWMNAAGIASGDRQFVDYILLKESSWNPNATNASSGAHGLCQSLPASKMASAGGDYMTNPVTQLKWCDGYAKGRYGSWAAAYSFWLSNHWW